MASVSPFFIIGLGFSVLAALAAFVITYEEWSHHYPSKREPFRHAMQAAIFAFLVFAALTAFVVVFVNNFMSG